MNWQSTHKLKFEHQRDAMNDNLRKLKFEHQRDAMNWKIYPQTKV